MPYEANEEPEITFTCSINNAEIISTVRPLREMIKARAALKIDPDAYADFLPIPFRSRKILNTLAGNFSCGCPSVRSHPSGSERMDKPLRMRLRLTKRVDLVCQLFDNATDYVTRRSRHNSRQLLRRTSRGRVAGMNCADDEHCKNN